MTCVYVNRRPTQLQAAFGFQILQIATSSACQHTVASNNELHNRYGAVVSFFDLMFVCILELTVL